MSDASSTRRRWYQFGLRTWLVAVALAAWMMASRTISESFSIPITKVRNQAWKSYPFYAKCGYVGPNAMEQLGLDFEKLRNFDHSRCLTLLATVRWGDNVHVVYTVIGLDHLIGPMSFLAALVAWKIGVTIAASRTGRKESAPQS